MNWKTPNAGDIRTRKIFAIWPRGCIDGKTRWLERLAIEEQCIVIPASGSKFERREWHELKACPAVDLCSCGKIDCEEQKKRGKIAAHMAWPAPPPRPVSLLDDGHSPMRDVVAFAMQLEQSLDKIGRQGIVTFAKNWRGWDTAHVENTFPVVSDLIRDARAARELRKRGQPVILPMAYTAGLVSRIDGSWIGKPSVRSEKV